MGQKGAPGCGDCVDGICDMNCGPVTAPDALTALKLALPYVESIASRQPTTLANTRRQRQAVEDAKKIRAAIAAVEAKDQ